MKQQERILPLPEMLSRRDRKHENGEWRIDDCQPVRGKPMTDIVGKHMVVPVGQEEVDRVIRAHEMMHARISPADDFQKWIDRKIATEQALRVVEEVRVNFLVKKAGFNTDVLGDGSELTAGTLLAERRDWAQLVYTAVGYASCGGGKDFLTGVRRVNRAWGSALKDITKQVEKEMTKAFKRGDLASTEIDPRTGLAPFGFSHVERLAEWIDRLANVDPDENQENNEEGEQGKGDVQPKEGDEKSKENANGATNKKAQDEKPPVDPNKVRPADHRGRNGAVPTWGELKVKRLPMTRRAKGGLGRKRIASPTGRNPRRIGNALVDPQRRVFDATKKGNGGIVLIDGSGSMSLRSQQILEITEQAPGCTVAVYSADRDNKKDNLLILAENGKMVDKLPDRNGGNGVDGEAIRWALKQRKRSSTPVVWITDGQVHGLGTGGAWGGYHDILAMDCIKESIKGKVFLAPTVDKGIDVLKQLKLGKTPKRWFPAMWQDTYQRLNGKRLVG